MGCSYGWLLSSIVGSEFEGYGVEPSPTAACAARNAGLRVNDGVYPQVVGEGQPYTVISFMDVLEHMDDPVQVLRTARQHLSPEGLVVIQVPDNNVFYTAWQRPLRVGPLGD